MRASQLLPAGVSGALVRMRHRVGAFFGEAPLLFIGVVLGIAVLFRVGLDALRPASAEAEAEVARPAAAAHEAPPAVADSAPTVTSPARSPAPASEPSAGRTSATAGVLDGARDEPRRSTRGAPHRRKPRTHGRR